MDLVARFSIDMFPKYGRLCVYGIDENCIAAFIKDVIVGGGYLSRPDARRDSRTLTFGHGVLGGAFWPPSPPRQRRDTQ
jgi:hypothetical protein